LCKVGCSAIQHSRARADDFERTLFSGGGTKRNT
jgi:hypothetical protein